MHCGRIFNTAVDAILAEFVSALEAVRCATDFQAALRTRNDQLPRPSGEIPNRDQPSDVMLHGQNLLGIGVFRQAQASLLSPAPPGSEQLI